MWAGYGSPGHSYLWSNNAPTNIDPRAYGSSEARGINDAGQIVGYWGANTTNYTEGYLLNNGIYTFFTVPFDYQQMYAYDINNVGQIVGAYLDNGGHWHGYMLDRWCLYEY